MEDYPSKKMMGEFAETSELDDSIEKEIKGDKEYLKKKGYLD